MIRRLLIANRGEIAIRVIRACRELGIHAIAVASDADREARHAREADQVEWIGGRTAAESYLNAPAILAAAQRARADAVHPGYGFLSERAAFADACARAGLTFVGPPASALAQMGSKIAARRLMQGAGVPVVPGETPADQTDEALLQSLRRVGFPALIKPSAGGGGIGMKVVREAASALDLVHAARREAQAAFGDPTLYVERYVERPRHVEIQVFADAHGHAIHLFERECSVQRRHQKVVEESPCPVLTPAVRDRMGAAAVAAAEAVGYVNAGTVEFLLEGQGDAARFYFLEMNTRLQVEHPVTEQLTGVDLVHAQLMVASGEPVPWRQDQLRPRGHAIECRVYAEDPRQQFLPQAGRLLLYREPQGPGIRIDAGVSEGDDIPVFYDPMIAKLIVTAESRAAAIARASAALRRYFILGIRTNIAYLLSILEHPRFQTGDIHTGFLEAERESLAASADQPLPAAAYAAAAWHGHRPPSSSRQTGPATRQPRPIDPFDAVGAWGRT